MQKRINSETGINKSFKNVSCQGCVQEFFEGGSSILSLFSNVFFPAELFLSSLSAKNDSRGVRGACFPWKIFEN